MPSGTSCVDLFVRADASSSAGILRWTTSLREPALAVAAAAAVCTMLVEVKGTIVDEVVRGVLPFGCIVVTEVL